MFHLCQYQHVMMKQHVNVCVGPNHRGGMCREQRYLFLKACKMWFERVSSPEWLYSASRAPDDCRVRVGVCVHVCEWVIEGFWVSGSSYFVCLQWSRGGSGVGKPVEVRAVCVCDQQSCHCLTLSCLEGLTLSPNQSLITINPCQKNSLPTL